MTAREYLELQETTNTFYVALHQHDHGCVECTLARIHIDVARSMLREGGYPDDVRECMVIYYDTVSDMAKEYARKLALDYIQLREGT